MVNNIYRCNKCKVDLLSEDVPTHSCKDGEWLDYKFNEDYSILWIFNGKQWFPRKWSWDILPPKTKHPFSTPDDETEPNNTKKNLNFVRIWHRRYL